MPAKAAAPAPAVIATWTGCYVGAGGGYGMYVAGTQVFDLAGSPFNREFDQGGRGWFGTVQVGCDFQAGTRIVIGAFADWDWSGIRGDFTGQGGDVGLVSNEMRLRDSWAAGGRIGWLVTPQLLTFFSGGWTQARFSQVDYLGLTGSPTGFSLPAARYNGYFLGGGVEYHLGWFPNLTWKTEYRWADYRSRDLTEFATPTGAPFAIHRVHPRVQTVRTELVWRFNWGSPAAVR